MEEVKEKAENRSHVTRSVAHTNNYILLNLMEHQLTLNSIDRKSEALVHSPQPLLTVHPCTTKLKGTNGSEAEKGEENQ